MRNNEIIIFSIITIGIIIFFLIFILTFLIIYITKNKDFSENVINVLIISMSSGFLISVIITSLISLFL